MPKVSFYIPLKRYIIVLVSLTRLVRILHNICKDDVRKHSLIHLIKCVFLTTKLF